ncbi:MAG: DNA helicase II [Rhodospirillaceae bacterium BRH_c57]|nr:MAG: DNA helicase II [Rhodospirillaceae bacterium BRH_c57]
MIDDPFELNDEPAFEPAPVAPQAPPPWLSGLNPEQAAAVKTTEGPLLVLSGAGTGKTRVLTTRLAHILYQRLAPPWNVLAVTFTNRAAKEMRERLGAMIGPVSEQVWLGTFHALGLKMLRRHCDLVGLRSGFSILDTDDQNRVLKGLMELAHIDTKKWPPNIVMGAIQRWKDRGWTPDAVPPHEVGDIADGKALELYGAYQKRLIEVNACDFGDLLLHVLTIFQAEPGILAEYQARFRYILVDEYQDANVSQYLWLRLLARQHKNICCVGDDDQSIYSWRGAEVGNILRFEHDFPGANIVRLERNYRSTPAILGAASGLIRNNATRLGKDLRAAGSLSQETGDKVTIHGVWDGEAEARWVLDTAQSLQRNGARLSDMAILVRAGFQTREFEERFITTGTPYRMIGGLRFYERAEIRDAIAYVRLLSQPDDDLAFERIVNLPKRGLGDASVQVLHLASRAQGMSLLNAARTVLDTDELKPRARNSLRTFVEDIDRWATLRTTMPPAELVATVLDESGYLAMWKADKAPEAPGRVENLQELVSALEDYTDLQEFLEHIALVMENDTRAGVEDAITLMTLHAAKGLEFDHVFLPGWEEQVFPHRRALEGGLSALEEERRLAYVGLTRARRRAFVSYAGSRRVFNQWHSNPKSRFVDEIPAEFKEEDGEMGLTAGSHGMSESYSTWNGGWGKPSGKGTGWERRKAEEKAGQNWQVAKREPSKSGFARGDRVFHQKFGYGEVIAAEDDKLQIAFDKAGQKKVMAGFVKPADEV